MKYFYHQTLPIVLWTFGTTTFLLGSGYDCIPVATLFQEGYVEVNQLSLDRVARP